MVLITVCDFLNLFSHKQARQTIKPVIQGGNGPNSHSGVCHTFIIALLDTPTTPKKLHRNSSSYSRRV